METKKGYVYFLKHNGLNPIKIGCTKGFSPIKRINCYNSYSPYGIDILGYIETDNHKELEKFLHETFKHLRLNNEWFDLSIEQVNSVISEFKINGEIDKSIIENKYISKDDILKKWLLNNFIIGSKIHNKELVSKFKNDFIDEYVYNAKSVINILKKSSIEFKKGNDVNGRYLILC